MFLFCLFTKDCWNILEIEIQDGSTLPQILLKIKTQPHPMFFMMMAILLCWAIWTVMNDYIFNNIQSQINSGKETYRKEMRLLSLREKA
jgi:hypothetical protein